jgi:hypothetical protein
MVSKTVEKLTPAWEKTVEVTAHARQRAGTATSKLVEELKPASEVVAAHAVAGWTTISSVVSAGAHEVASVISGEKGGQSHSTSDTTGSADL